MFTRLENELAILERHLRVLDAVRAEEPCEVTALASRLPYPAHKVRYSVRVLEAENLVASTSRGIATTDRAGVEGDAFVTRLAALAREVEGVPRRFRASLDD